MTEWPYGGSSLPTRAIERMRGLPEFRRAREYRLYTGDGRRYIDLWADDGQAAAGHRCGRWRETLSSKLSRGLAFPLPGPEAHKLRKAVRAWFSLEMPTADGREMVGQRPVYFFHDETARWKELSSAAPELVIRDALYSTPDESAAAVVVRPFSRPHVNRGEWILPVLPLPRAFALCCLLGPAGMGPDSGVQEDLLAPAVLAAGARAVYDVCRMLRSGTHPGKAFAERLAATGVWTACGPWLLPSVGADESAYDRLFAEHAAKHIVLNPVAGAPSLVPAVMSSGERSRILAAAEHARRCGLGG